MENLKERIALFLNPGSGNGSGNGYGYGDGNGYGDGVKNFCGEAVYIIDGVQTIIRNIRGNVAKGCILNGDLTTTPSFVAKQDGKFAHGETLRDALSALRDKLFDDMSVEDRIAAFIQEHEFGKEYPCKDLYEWHHRLTGSCEMGRKMFAADHEIDIDHDKMTVEQFVNLTKNAYGGDVIKTLEKEMGFVDEGVK